MKSAITTLIAGTAMAQSLKPGQGLSLGECRFDDGESMAVLMQWTRDKNGMTRVYKPKQKLAVVGLDPDTEYTLNVRDFGSGTTCGDGPIIEPIGSFYPSFVGDVIAFNFSYFMGLYSDWDPAIGSDYGRDITIDSAAGTELCCVITGSVQQDKSYLRQLNREFKQLYREIMGRNSDGEDGDGRRLSGVGSIGTLGSSDESYLDDEGDEDE